MPISLTCRCNAPQRHSDYEAHPDDFGSAPSALSRQVEKPHIRSAREVRSAVRQADVLGLPLGPEVDSDRTRSELEASFLDFCRRHRLPEPEVNVRLDRHLVDFLWRDKRLVVETDGYRYHRGRVAFEDDRGRDLELRARGYEVIRLSERQLLDDPQGVMEVLAAALRVGADAAGSA